MQLKTTATGWWWVCVYIHNIHDCGFMLCSVELIEERDVLVTGSADSSVRLWTLEGHFIGAYIPRTVLHEWYCMLYTITVIYTVNCFLYPWSACMHTWVGKLVARCKSQCGNKTHDHACMHIVPVLCTNLVNISNNLVDIDCGLLSFSIAIFMTVFRYLWPESEVDDWGSLHLPASSCIVWLSDRSFPNCTTRAGLHFPLSMIIHMYVLCMICTGACHLSKMSGHISTSLMKCDIIKCSATNGWFCQAGANWVAAPQPSVHILHAGIHRMSFQMWRL